jgi:hypothetical protein
MKNIHTRIQAAERTTSDAQRLMGVSQRMFREAFRRKVTSPLALISAFGAGFAVARSKTIAIRNPVSSQRLRQLMHLAALGVWSVGYDMIISTLRSRRT